MSENMLQYGIGAGLFAVGFITGGLVGNYRGKKAKRLRGKAAGHDNGDQGQDKAQATPEDQAQAA